MWGIGVIAAIASSILAHAILTRAAPRANAVLLFLAGGTTIGLALVAWAWHVFGLVSIPFVSAVVSYAALSELYVFLFTLALSSVSANIIVRLTAASPGAADLARSYSGVDMVQQRIARLQAAGLIVGTADGFVLTRRGTLVVAGYRMLRALFRHA